MKGATGTVVRYSRELIEAGAHALCQRMGNVVDRRKIPKLSGILLYASYEYIVPF